NHRVNCCKVKTPTQILSRCSHKVFAAIPRLGLRYSITPSRSAHIGSNWSCLRCLMKMASYCVLSR
ncbi:HAMP domain protein, partial [Vibrio parahaemolyticus V-223/04]